MPETNVPWSAGTLLTHFWLPEPSVRHRKPLAGLPFSTLSAGRSALAWKPSSMTTVSTAEPWRRIVSSRFHAWGNRDAFSPQLPPSPNGAPFGPVITFQFQPDGSGNGL